MLGLWGASDLKRVMVSLGQHKPNTILGYVREVHGFRWIAEGDPQLAAACLAQLRQGSGYIVNIGAIGGLIAIPCQPLYSASKFALKVMTGPYAGKYGCSASAWSSSSR
jgi:NAD(P)-dependent dehydrogenase (short-subunit alcohol dehydrogenase family)